MTKLKINLKDFIYNVGFLFRPIATIAVSFTFLIIIVTLLIVLIINIDENSQLYQILLAILTGATSSLFIAIMMELFNNYRFNTKRQRELREYLSNIAHYEIVQKSIMKTNAKPEYHSELGSGRAYAVFVQLEEIIPTLKEALNQRDYLYRKEIEEIDHILYYYKDIVNFIKMPLLYEFSVIISNKTTGIEVENAVIDLEQKRKQIEKENHPSVIDDYESIADYSGLLNFLKNEVKQYVENKNGSDASIKDFEQLESIIEKAIFYEREIFYGYFEMSDDRAKFVDLVDDEGNREREAMPDKKKNFETRSNIISHACGNIDRAMINLHKRVKKEPYFWAVASYKE